LLGPNLHPDPNCTSISLYSTVGGSIARGVANATRVAEYLLATELSTARIEVTHAPTPVEAGQEYWVSTRLGWYAGSTAVSMSAAWQWYSDPAGTVPVGDPVELGVRSGASAGEVPCSARVGIAPATARCGRVIHVKDATAEASRIYMTDPMVFLCLPKERLSSEIAGLVGRVADLEAAGGAGGSGAGSIETDRVIAAKVFREEFDIVVPRRLTVAEATALSPEQRQAHDYYYLSDATPGQKFVHRDDLPEFVSFGDVTLDRDFDGGDYDPSSAIAGDQSWVYLAEREPITTPGWGRRTFMARLRGVAGKSPTIFLLRRSPGNYNYSQWRICWAVDPKGPWYRFDNEDFDTPNNRFELSNDAPFASDTIYLATAPRYTVERYDDKIKEWLGHPLTRPTPSAIDGYRIGTVSARVCTNGRSVPDIDSHAFCVGTGPRKVLLTSGIHQDEFVGHYMFEGFVETILGVSARAQRLRRDCTFFVYPRVNAQGLHAGETRVDVETDSDCNRIWYDPDPNDDSELRTIYQDAFAIDLPPQVDVALDFHGWRATGGMGFWYRADISAETARQPFLSNFAAHHDVDQLYPTFTSAYTMSYAARQFGTPYLVMVFEHKYGIDFGPEEWRDAGRHGAWALDDTIRQGHIPPPSPPVNAVLPKIIGEPFSGRSLWCSEGGWTGSPLGALSRQWQIDSGGWQDIENETGPSYAGASNGSVIRCAVTLTNAAGETTAYTDPVTIVAVPSPTPGFDPANLFVARSGGSYRPTASKLLRQVAGGIPVTAPGQTVEMMYDHADINRFSNTFAAPNPTYRASGTAEWLEFNGSDRLYLFPESQRDIMASVGQAFASIVVLPHETVNLASTNGFFVTSITETSTSARLLLGLYNQTLQPHLGGRRLNADSLQVLAADFEISEKFVLTAIVDYQAGHARLYKDGDLVSVAPIWQTPGLTSSDRPMVSLGGAVSGGLNSHFDFYHLAFGPWAPTPQELVDLIAWQMDIPGEDD
jgi:hypothetical protein